MMSYINETDFVVENKKLVYPEIVTDGLQLYYDAKGKRDTDYHRDTMLDMSGNKNHGKLHNFAYEKHSGYKDGLVFDYIDDKLVRPALNLKPDDFTFMLNGNIISFSPDGTVKRVQDGEVIESKGFNLITNGDFSDGTTGWTIQSGATVTVDTTYSATKLKVVSASTFVGIIQNKLFIDGNLIYASFIGCGDVSTQLTVGNTELGRFAMTATPKMHSIIKPWAVVATDRIGLYNIGIGTNYYGYFVVIDLTATFGAGNEPTKEQMDEIINRFGFIPNAQDLIDRVEYKGNDLGDMENIIDGLYKTDILSGEEIYTDKADDAVVHVEVDGNSVGGGSGKNLVELDLLEQLSTLRVKYPLGKLKPGIAYYVSFKNKDYTFWNGGGWVSEGPINDNIRSTGVVIRKGTGNSGAGEEYTVGELIKDGLFQIEEGSVATAYEPPAPTPDYPIEIHSLNDFDVVSSIGGRNLVLNSSTLEASGLGAVSGTRAEYRTINTGQSYMDLEDGETITISFNIEMKIAKENPTLQVYNSNVPGRVGIPSVSVSNQLQGDVGETINKRISFTTHAVLRDSPRYSYNTLEFYSNYGSDNFFKISKLKVEHGNKATSWTPAPEDIIEDSNHPLIDKINLLLDEPLRSVGDVKDRLFRDSDGIWKIERNVGETHLGSTDIASISIGSSNNVVTTIKIDNMKYYTSSYGVPFRSTHHGKMKGNPGSSWGTVENRGTATVNTTGSMWLSVDKENVDTIEKARNWLESQKTVGTPVTVQYELETSITETLSQELQDKLNNLRSFEDSNYVYTVLTNENNTVSNNLKPTLHAKFLYNNWYKEDRVINNLMVYNRALTNEEMLQNYKTIKRRWGM